MKLVLVNLVTTNYVHCYVAGSIPAVTPRYCTKKIKKMLFGAQKIKGKKTMYRYTVKNGCANLLCDLLFDKVLLITK